MEYGTFLNVEVDHGESIHSLISSYFNNPIMIKLLNHNNESHYYCKINTKLLGEHRYIIAITTNDNTPINTKKYLKNINWSSFQTRGISRNYNINSISYNSNILSKIYLKLKEKNDKFTSYTSSQLNNINVHILNQSGKIYPHQATLENAIEEFRTLIII